MSSATSTSVFSATAFNPSLTDGRATIELALDADSCSFAPPTVSSSSFTKVRLPFNGIKLERGGANNRVIFLSHPSYPAWRIAVSDPAFVKALSALNSEALKDNLKVANKIQQRGRVVTLSVVVVLAGILYGLYLMKDPAVRVLADTLPLSWEQQAGEKLFALHRASGKIVDDAKVKESLQRFIDPLVVELKKTGYDPKVFIEKSEELNAFALPGGYVVLNSEVLQRADSPEEVLGVLAHEFAHVSERHVLRGLISTIGIYFGVSILIGDYAGSFAALGDALPHLINLSFSRDYEREADNIGVSFLQRANINPRGMVSFFKKIEEEEKKVAAISDIPASLSFLSTHPNTVERVAALEKKLLEIEAGKKEADYLALTTVFNELKAALEQVP